MLARRLSVLGLTGPDGRLRSVAAALKDISLTESLLPIVQFDGHIYHLHTEKWTRKKPPPSNEEKRLSLLVLRPCRAVRFLTAFASIKIIAKKDGKILTTIQTQFDL